MGNVHRFGDRRLPVPGILGIIASAAACVLAALAGRPVASGAWDSYDVSAAARNHVACEDK
jgi:hypothetical protein